MAKKKGWSDAARASALATRRAKAKWGNATQADFTAALFSILGARPRRKTFRVIGVSRPRRAKI